MTIVIAEAALPARAAAAAAAGLPLTALRLAEAAGLSELTIDQALQGLKLGGAAVGGARRLSKERRLRRQRRREEQRARAREEIARAREEIARTARAAEREAEIEHERKLAAIRAGAPHAG